MTTNNNWLSPSWHEARDVFNNNRFSENSTVENVTNGTVWRLPHLFEVELFDTAFIRRDGSALDANFVLLHRVCAVNGDLVGCCVTVLHA